MSRLDEVVAALTSGRGSRRELLRRATAAGLLGPLAAYGPDRSIRVGAQARADVALGSQRPMVGLLGEYPYWVARKLGYFGELRTSLDVADAASSRTIDRLLDGTLDMAHALPGPLLSAVSAGEALVSVFQLGAYDPFDIALQRGNPAGIMSARDLEGKVVAVADASWSEIVDPLVHQAGGDVALVTYDVRGASWVQALYDGEADAALTWAGLRAEWLAGGLDFDYLLGKARSPFPGDAFQVRRADLEDAGLTDLYVAYLRGWAMGLEFAHHNPRAAVQITMEAKEVEAPLAAAFPDKAVAVRTMWQLADLYRGDWVARDGGAWGWHDLASWTAVVDASRAVGLITDPDLAAEAVVTNDLVVGANDFDREAVTADADAFELKADFVAVEEPAGAGAEGAYPT